jgi:integrase
MSTAKATSRRPRGTGSIEIKNCVYYGTWRQDGRRVKRSLGPVRTPGRTDGLTVTMAETKLRKLMGDSTPPITERITVAEAGDRYIARRELLGRQPSTLRSYRNVLARQIKPRAGHVPIVTLERRQVEAMIDDLVRDGYTPKTIRNIVGILSGICRYAVKQGWATRNACDGLELPKVRRSTDIRYLTPDELELMLGAVDTDDYGRVYRAAYLTAALSGLRSGEIRALRWRDVDWTARKLHVRQNRVRKHVGTPKTARSSRAVPLATRVASELDALSRTTEWPRDDDLVFANPYTGDPLDGDALLQALYRAEQCAGVRRVTFHELRHTFGTQTAAAGVPLTTLQEWMGHEHISTTMIYAHYVPGEHEADMLDAAFPDRAQQLARGTTGGTN